MVFEGRIEKGMVVVDIPLPLPDGTPVLVEPIPGADFWRPLSLDELTRQQGVSAPAAVDELLGGWPEEDRDDQFEEALANWRERVQRR
ncbi:MAG TPA: hypothetical protein VJ783_28760 [Pirellulales bacterium]|nr:hypothetical protein [Pirellulales bacterium]